MYKVCCGNEDKWILFYSINKPVLINVYNGDIPWHFNIDALMFYLLCVIKKIS